MEQVRREPGISLTGNGKAELTADSCFGLIVSSVVCLLGAIKNWKAAESGRAGIESRGRECSVMVKR